MASFDYDPLDRLTGFLRGTASQDFTYDANGNRLSLAAGTATTNYQYATGSNRLQGRSGAVTTAYAYDAAGNMTGDGSRAYTYDGRGRMVKVVKGAATNQYLLNGLGQRVSKSGSGVTGGSNLFVYDEAGNLIGEYSGTGVLLRETVWLGGMPVGVLTASAINYVYPDHLDAPWAITNQSGATVWTWNRDPFGTTAPTGSLTYNFRFPGQYFDKETGLFYNYYRDYDPATGRYAQSDPIGIVAGINTYIYSFGNAIINKDVFGLDIWIEGPSGQEPSFHQSVNVGDPFGVYYSYSFGIDGNFLEGAVYRDWKHGGIIELYKTTSLQQDIAFKKWLDSQVGMTGIYGYDDICRSWSQKQFNNAPGKLTKPPVVVSAPTVGTGFSSFDSSTNSSSNVGTWTSR